MRKIILSNVLCNELDVTKKRQSTDCYTNEYKIYPNRIKPGTLGLSFDEFLNFHIKATYR